MKLNRVLVVFKRRIGGTHPGRKASVNLARWQRLHEQSLARVEAAFARAGVGYGVVDRNDLRGTISADLIVTVGGDGTVLAAAHAADGVPIAGINSMPGRSVGFFCAATAASFSALLRDIAAGKIAPRRLPLIAATIGREPVPVLALNDVLFAGTSPAEMLRYTIAIDGKKEPQRSSGVWIAAGPGSTAAMLAAGGKKLPVASPRLQYLVREPHWVGKCHYRLIRGCAPAGGSISITPDYGDAAIYIDGPGRTFPVPPGTKLTVKTSSRTVALFLR